MDLLKTTLGLTRAIKNVGRLREIITVFAKNGLEEFIVKAKIHEFIPNFVFPAEKKIQMLENANFIYESRWGQIGYRLRLSFEELGPAFIKFGQMLSTREDFFHEDFASELKKLQDEVKGITYVEALPIIEKNLGKKIHEVFLIIVEKPIAAASIATVFKAKLLNGEDVVIKVKRPGIEELIESDFSLLALIVDRVEKRFEGVKYLGLSRLVEDFYQSIKLECNLSIERFNLEKLRANQLNVSESKTLLVFPKSFGEFSNRDMLVIEFLDGIPFKNLTPNQITEDLKEKLLDCVQLFMISLLKDGFFHADLHGGNFFYLSDGRIGVVDFGLVGTLSQKNRIIFLSILYHLVMGDFETLVYELIEVSDYEQMPNAKSFSRDLERALGPYLGLNASQINSPLLFKELVKVLSFHKLFLPREWTLIFRALMTLDGVGRSLGVDINTMSVLDKHTKDVAKNLVTKEKLMEQGMWLAKDIMHSTKMLPKHLSWFLTEFSKNNYSIELRHQGVEKYISSINNSMRFLGFIILSCSFLFMGLFFIDKTIEFSFLTQAAPTYISWLLSIGFLLTALRLK